MADTDNITELLSRMHRGDKDVVSRILPLVHGELRRIARFYFRSASVWARVLDTSDLVQDAAIRIFISRRWPLEQAGSTSSPLRPSTSGGA